MLLAAQLTGASVGRWLSPAQLAANASIAITPRRPAGTPRRPAGTPRRPWTPRRPAGTPRRPAGTPRRPWTPRRPAGTPRRPAGTPRRPAGTPRRPAGTPRRPAGTPHRPAGTPLPAGTPRRPWTPHRPSHIAGTSSDLSLDEDRDVLIQDTDIDDIMDFVFDEDINSYLVHWEDSEDNEEDTLL